MMLVYEVIPEIDGRPWLLAITHEDVEVRELPGSAPLGDAVAVFEGLLRTDEPLAALLAGLAWRDARRRVK